MTRILFMHQSSGIGGGSYCLLNVVKCLDRAVWEPVVALHSNGPLADELMKLGVEVVIFPQMSAIPYNKGLTIRNLITYWHAVKSGKKLEILLQSAQIDVLYLNNMMIAPYLRAAKKVGCKTVLHVREHWPLDEHKKQLEWVRKIVYAYCDKLIAINHYSANIFPEKDATIIYDWIDMSTRYKPLPLSYIFNEDMKGKKVFLFTGGMDRIKGGLHVANTFITKLKDPDCRLLMLGVDTEIKYNGVKGKLRKYLSYFGIEMQSDRLRRLAKTDKRIVCHPAIYELSHIIQQSYCMLSYFTIPHANLGLAECLILGTPVVCVNTEESIEYSNGAIPELMFSINNGFAFEQSLGYLQNNYASIKSRIDTIRYDIALKFNKELNEKKLSAVLEEMRKS